VRAEASDFPYLSGAQSMIEVAIWGIVLAFSLVALAWGSHLTIKSIEKLLEFVGTSEASVGFAILAWMTSVPEITVAIFSVLEGRPGISVGDVLGSNVFNIGVVVGVLATIGFLKKCSTDLLMDLLDILFLSSLIPLLLIVFKVFSSVVGVVLLVVYGFSIYTMTRRRSPASASMRKVASERIDKKRVILSIIGGMIIVVLASRFVVSSAINIATILGVPTILIGAKIIAIGTSMPELVLDLTAARRGRIHLAIGDAVGSNLTNLTLVLGIVLLASPSPVAINLTVFAEILPFVLITTLILWRFLTKGGVPQVGGIILLITYIIFQATIVE